MLKVLNESISTTFLARHNSSTRLFEYFWVVDLCRIESECDLPSELAEVRIGTLQCFQRIHLSCSDR